MWYRSALNFFASRIMRTSGRTNRRPLRDRRTTSRRLQLEPLEDRRLLTSYHLTELGNFTPYDINAAGQVVGGKEGWRAALWNNGTIIDLGTLELGGLNGGSTASAINDLGQVVGWSSVLVEDVFATHAFLITPEDTDEDNAPDRWFRDFDADGVNDLMIDLGVPAGANSSMGVDINNAGLVVAVGNNKAFLWDSGEFTELDAVGAVGTGATDINDAGQVVGHAADDVGYYHPFLWNSSGGTDLGTIDYPYGRATAINASGSVVGLGLASDATTQIAFLWTPDQPNGMVGVMTALDPLPSDSFSEATDINDAGQVLGTSTYVTTYCEDDGFGEACTPYYSTRVVLWESGVATELQAQLVGDQYMTLHTAKAINAAGQVVGSGSEGGYLLTPTDLALVSVDSVVVVEGDSGIQSVNFTVSLDKASDQTVMVAYATADGTATAGSDYLAAANTLVFAPGETSKTVPVVVSGDTLYEPNESFFLNLISVTSALLADGSGTGTIQNDDPIPPSLVISDASVTEGNAGTVSATFTVSLSAAYGQPVAVHYETASGSATAGSDYTNTSGEVIIPAGETSRSFAIAVMGDRVGELNETFFVTLSNATNATIADGQGVATIVDDEPRISITDLAIAEGKKGQSTLFTFTITLSAAYDEPVTMSYRTVNGTATTSNKDYVAKTGTLTFAPGETTKTITIEVKGDSKKEANETFYLDLFGLSSNAQFTKNRGIGTILNDD